jgi:hypothetical protein
MFVGYRKSFESNLIFVLRFGDNISNISSWSRQINYTVSSSVSYNNMSAIKIINDVEYDHSENNK